MINAFIAQHKLKESFESNARQYFVPLSLQINGQQSQSPMPYFIGINGCQGSGKSTLTEFLKIYLSTTFGLNVVTMSLDDFYYGHKDRQHIAKNIHPLLKTRGVPGTHNIALAKSVLLALKNRQTTAIPRFNKALDDVVAASKTNIVNTHVDVIDWKGTRGGRDVEPLVAETVQRLQATFENGGSVGVLTHHLVHDEAVWVFLDQLFEVTTDHPGCKWVPITTLLAI